jgi:putative phosphoesterase
VSTVVGVISDTHGLLRPEAVAALAGSRLILHAGDVGDPDVLARLAEIAPVHAVRGNNDRGAWADALPETELVTVAGVRLFLIHDVKQLAGPPAADAIVAGHSHRPRHEVRDGVLWFNPGSAGPRRFKLPVTVGRLTVARRRIAPEIVAVL